MQPFRPHRAGEMPFYATVGQISLLDELHESYSDARLMPFGAEGAGNTRIPLSPGIAALRAPLPCPLAAGALAKHCYQGVTRPGGRYFVSVQPLPSIILRSET